MATQEGSRPPLHPGMAPGWYATGDGRYAYDLPTGERIYSPTTADMPKGTLLKSPRFNSSTGRWETTTNWGNVVGLATLGVIGAGMGAGIAAGAGGGAAGTAGAGGASSVGADIASAMGVPGTVGTLAASAGGGGILSTIMKGLKNYGALIPAGLSAVNAFRGQDAPDRPYTPFAQSGSGAGATSAPGNDPRLQELLNLSQRRVTASEPLYDALSNMARAQLPRYTRGE